MAAEFFLNGDFVAPENAKVSVLDRGFLFGDDVYEVIPVYGGCPLREAAHLRRLGNSLRGIGMVDPLSEAEWSSVFARLIASSPALDQALYLQVTRGAAPARDHRFPTGIAPTVLAMIKPMRPRDPSIAEQGVSAVLRDDIRWLRCDIKATALLAAVLLRQAADEAGAEEAILIRDGLAHEGSTSNIFLVKAGTLITPPKGPLLLPGITRDIVLELASGAGVPTEERDVAAAELQDADELWITSSTREVMPVTVLDGAAIGDGRPGPLWGRVDGLYHALKEELRRRDDAL